MRRTLTVAATVCAALFAFNEAAHAAWDCQTGTYGGRGYGLFRSYGEHLHACDINPDGLRVTAYAKWLDVYGIYHIRQTYDPNGAADGCSDLNMDIDEGAYVEVWACIEGLGCTPRVEGRA